MSIKWQQQQLHYEENEIKLSSNENDNIFFYIVN